MESLLLLGIVAFYLFDAMLLLYGDEIVFAQCGRRWRASAGSGFMLAGRYPVLPAVLSPGALVFRSAWGAPASGDGPGVEALQSVLRPLRWPARLVAVLLFAVVPVALLVNLEPRLMLGLLVLLYLASLLSVAHVARRRSALGLSRKDLASIAFDVIACPPFAINLVRRVTLRCGLAVPASEFAAARLDPESHARLVRTLDARRAGVSEFADIEATDDDAPPSSGGEGP